MELTLPKGILEEKEHKYYVKGDERVDPSLALPSVTGIAGYSANSDPKWLILWAINAFIETSNKFEWEKRFHEAGKFGTKLHKLISETIQGEHEEQKHPMLITDEHKALMKSWSELMNEKKVKFIDSELIVWNPNHLYAGTLDALGEVDGSITVFDWKTKNKTGSPDPRHAVQIAGYVLALEAMTNLKSDPKFIMPEPTRAAIVYLYKDTGKARWYEVDLLKAKFAFMHCLNLFNIKDYYVK